MTNHLPSNNLALNNIPEPIKAIMQNMGCDEHLATWLYEQHEKGLIPRFGFSLVLPRELTETEQYQQQFKRAAETLANIGSHCMLHIPGATPPITRAKIDFVTAAKHLSFKEMTDVFNDNTLVLATYAVGATDLRKLKEIDPNSIVE